MDATVLGVVVAVLACLAALLFMARGSGAKPVAAPSAEVRGFRARALCGGLSSCLRARCVRSATVARHACRVRPADPVQRARPDVPFHTPLCVARALAIGSSARTQPPPAKAAPQEAKPEAAKKQPAGGKKGKKDDKKHPQCLFVCKGHTGEITCSRVSMTGKMMCSAGEDRKVILWNIAVRPPTAQLTFSPELDHGAAIAMSPDDKFFAVVFARSKEVKIFPTKGAKEGAQVRRKRRRRLPETSLTLSRLEHGARSGSPGPKPPTLGPEPCTLKCAGELWHQAYDGRDGFDMVIQRTLLGDVCVQGQGGCAHLDAAGRRIGHNQPRRARVLRRPRLARLALHLRRHHAVRRQGLGGGGRQGRLRPQGESDGVDGENRCWRCLWTLVGGARRRLWWELASAAGG